jgi:HSP20 family protein
MNVTAYTPFDSQIDRLFNEAIRNIGRPVPTWVPKCNVWEEDEHFTLQLALPGWQSQEVALSVENGVVTVEGQRKRAAEIEPGNGRICHLQEVEDGSFSRSFTLPMNLEWDKATASLKDGLLTVEFPKRDEAKPRRIMIQ